MDSRRHFSEDDETALARSAKKGISSDPFDVFDSLHGHGHGHGHSAAKGLGDQEGTIENLWEAAIDKYPDIVARYGEFSGELLQAMLGLAQVEGASTYANKPSNAVTGLGNSAQSMATEKPQVQSYTLQQKKYSKLNAQTQEIIMAGRLGQKVKSVEGADQSGWQQLVFQPDVDSPLSIDTMSMFASPNA